MTPAQYKPECEECCEGSPEILRFQGVGDKKLEGGFRLHFAS